MKLEMLITGSSRPQLWPFFWESVKKMCIMRNWPKVMVHEDYVFHAESDKVVEYVKNQKDIHTIDIDNPPLGLGRTLTRYFKGRLKSKYLFYLQEDWEFERPIDIDQIMWVMDNNPHINMIFFNKIKNNGVIAKMSQEPRNFSGLDVCVYHGWSFLPGIWRREFVEKQMYKSGGSFRPERPEGAFTNSFGTHDGRIDTTFCEKNIGAYIYGSVGDFRYVRHLGNDWRMAKWRLEGPPRRETPGGRHSEDMDVPYMAPWVPYLKRPVRVRDSKEEIDKMLKGENSVR